jgi:site-specific DNA-methyltransferase (adenine-specific)
MYIIEVLVLSMSSFTFVEQHKNKHVQMNGLDLMGGIPDAYVSACVFDPQYREILDKMKFGNEGDRMSARASLEQMPTSVIMEFLVNIERVLKPSAYLFLWVDKLIVAQGLHLNWFSSESKMELVDLITWNKELMGMGKRSRRLTEFLVVLQKQPKTTKNWSDKGIVDGWDDYHVEKIPKPRTKGLHPHRKPNGLTGRLINSVTDVGDLVLDPCAGSFSTFDVCKELQRDFIGSDLTLDFV